MYRIVISHLLGCQQFIWKGIVTKVAVDGFKKKKKTSRFTEKSIQPYDDESSKECILEADVSYLKHQQNTHSDLLFLPAKRKIDKCRNKLDKLACTMYER